MRRDTPALACTPAEARAMVDAAKSGASVSLYRAVEPQPMQEHNGLWSFEVGRACGAFYTEAQAAYALERACPYGKPGDVLDALEPWKSEGAYPDNGQPHIAYEAGGRDFFNGIADWARYLRADRGWQPAESMPAWAVRLALRVGAVSVVQQQGEWRWALTGTVTPKGASRAE